MKYNQIDDALMFVDDSRTVVLQHEFMHDRDLIVDYIRDESIVKDRISRIVEGMIELDRRDNLKRIIMVCVSDHVRMQMTENTNYYISFFIERRYDEYREGNNISDKPIPTKMRNETSTSVFSVRKHTDPVSYYGITIVRQPTDDIDDRTLVLQFADENMRSILQGIVRSRKRKSAESFIDESITVDVFVDLSLHPTKHTGELRGKSWLRVVYERLNDYPAESLRRYPGATIIRVDRTLNKPSMTLDMLLEGR